MTDDELLAALRTLRPTGELPGVALFKADLLEKAGIDLAHLQRWASANGGGALEAGAGEGAQGAEAAGGQAGTPAGVLRRPAHPAALTPPGRSGRPGTALGQSPPCLATRAVGDTVSRVPHQLDHWMYRGGRPNRLARGLNRLWSRMAASGKAPQQMYSLEVRGRLHGQPISLPVVVADHEGERYLVSMLGEGANWVANVRAADGHAVLRHGRREEVRLEEVASELRGPILQRYIQLAPGARAHIAVDPTAPLAEFDAIAGEHPVFLVRSDSAPTA